VEIYKGTSAFSGIAIGKILYYHRGEYQIRQSMVDNVKKELDRLDNARTAVKNQIQHMYKNGAPLPKEQELTLKRQLKLLSGGSFQRAVESMITTEKVSAAYAVQTTRDELANVFRKLEDEAVKEQIENIREISELLIGAMGGSHARINLGDEPVILAAEQLSPNELLEMNKASLLAVVMHQGSVISHVSIMAKSMEVPTLVEVEIQKEWDGHMAIVDGYTGTLYIDPEPELLKEYEIRHAADKEEREELLRLRNQKDITADGKEIKLLANIGNLDDLNTVLYYGAAGIGLLRSEFQYLGRENYPRENELFRAYKKVAETMGERLAVIRTADLGADKQAPYLDIPQETNPIMGNRGIRLCLDRRRMFKAQLRAIYRASAYGNLAMMFPMIDSEEEMDEIEKIIGEVKEGLREKDIPFKDIMTGIMIETPAAVMISRELAIRVDFLSIGTNDLTQYTLAMDRQNPLLKDKYNDHHPAVLRMVRMVVESAHKEGKRVGICGELAADTALTGKFLEMGVDFLSVVPACVLPVRKAIRETDLSGVSAPKVNEDNNE
jgi:phosphotransferase system enzyme I (PtsI)